MKRPVPIYFVAAWCFLGLMRQTRPLSGMLTADPSKGQGWGQSLLLLSLIIIIWHTVRLVQLRSLNLWLSICFFSLWTATMAWNYFALAHRFSDPARAITVLSVFVALNLVSVWYLARSRFRKFSAAFVVERKAARKSAPPPSALTSPAGGIKSGMKAALAMFACHVQSRRQHFITCFVLATFLPWNWLAADDLTHWQMRTSAAVNQVRYLNNRFVAVGTNIMTSLDGANWTSHSSSGAVLNSAIYVFDLSPAYYLAVGSALRVSTDGSTWTNVPASLPESFTDVAWGGINRAVFVATPQLTPGRVYVSTNLLNWAPVLLTNQFSYPMKKVIRALAYFWIVGGGGFDDHILRSRNGTDWEYSVYANQYAGDFVFANGILVFIGREGCPMRYDFGLWSFIPDPSFCPPYLGFACLHCHYGDGATFGDEKYVSVVNNVYSNVVGPGTRILASTNLQSWQQRTFLDGADFHTIAYGAGSFVAAGRSGIWQSVPVVIPQVSLVRKSSTGLAVRVAAELGHNHTLQYSYNFSNWQDQQVFLQLTPIMEFQEPLNLQLPSKFLRVRSP